MQRLRLVEDLEEAPLATDRLLVVAASEEPLYGFRPGVFSFLFRHLHTIRANHICPYYPHCFVERPHVANTSEDLDFVMPNSWLSASYVPLGNFRVGCPVFEMKSVLLGCHPFI